MDLAAGPDGMENLPLGSPDRPDGGESIYRLRHTDCLYRIPTRIYTSTAKRHVLKAQNKLERFQAVTMVTMKLTVVWNVTPCNVVEFHRSFGGIYCHHLRCRRITLYRKMEEMTYQNGCSRLIQNAANLLQITRRHIADDLLICLLHEAESFLGS